MKLFDLLATASSNMFRSKLRTLLTITAIFIGAFTLTITTGLGLGVSQYLDRQVDAFGAKDLDKIREIDGIKSVAAYHNASIDYVVASDPDKKYQASVTPFLTGSNFSLDAGRYPDNDSKDLELMLPSTYLELLGLGSAESAVGKTVKFGVTNGLGKRTEVEGKISGILGASLVAGTSISPNDALMTRLRAVQAVGQPPVAGEVVQAATARFDAADTEKLKKIKEDLKKLQYEGMTVEDQIGSFKAVINGMIAVLNGFALIALLAAGFGIINTLLMSIQERTKEIGLMKAMGMSPKRIFLLFSMEAVMLGFWGSLLGSLAAIGVGTVVNKLVIESFLKDLVGLQLLTFSPVSVASVILLVMAISFLAGTMPAIRAARKNPIDSLRYE
ncbi:MAG: Permease [Candidatus Saccharibacteria bacterium]|nr:Permease [Candidatus Saccharibacteria bacterium]